MNKFSIISSDNPYINYTLHNYIDCYDDLDNDSINRFSTLFEKLKQHEISIGNHLVERKPLQGIKLVEKSDKEKEQSPSPQLEGSVNSMKPFIDHNNRKELEFYKSIVCLCSSIEHLDSDQLSQLNNLFIQIHQFKSTINDPVVGDNMLFYSYNRYPKKK